MAARHFADYLLRPGITSVFRPRLVSQRRWAEGFSCSGGERPAGQRTNGSPGPCRETHTINARYEGWYTCQCRRRIPG